MSILNDLEEWKTFINLRLLNETLGKISPINICPNKDNVFKAFKLCSPKDCKIVFLGQDPYPQKGVATGILFGNSKDTSEDDLSPSLKVIKEAAIDPTIPHNLPIEFDNTLESWAEQGILMLNSALTTETNKIGSHVMAWRPFMVDFIRLFSKCQFGTLYVLFGQQAQTFAPYIDKRNFVIRTNHPAYYARTNQSMSPNLFYDINELVEKQFGEKIEWYKEYSYAK